MEKRYIQTQMSRRDFISASFKVVMGLGSTSILGLLSWPSMNRVFAAEGNLLRMQSPWINDAEFIGYFVAINNGYYKDEGIEFKYLPGGPEIVADSVLLAKRSEIALTTPDVTINAIIKQGAPFKIIGAQYQKNPLGIVSLEKNKILKPIDLIGKTIAVPPANQLTIAAFLKINNIPKEKVRIVPYQYDPTPLLNGEVDATLDFVTNVPFSIKERGGAPTSFLLYDFGLQIFNDTVVVREETLRSKRDLLRAWLRASRKGWEENFRNESKYPQQFASTFFRGTGRSVDNEIYFNKAQRQLIEAKSGIFSMTEDAISSTIKSLQAVGINARRDMFVTDLL